MARTFFTHLYIDNEYGISPLLAGVALRFRHMLGTVLLRIKVVAHLYACTSNRMLMHVFILWEYIENMF